MSRHQNAGQLANKSFGNMTKLRYLGATVAKWNCIHEEIKSRLNSGNAYYRDSSVGIALGYGLDDRGSRVRFLAGTGNFSLHHRVQNGSGAHPACYPMRTRGCFPGGKAAGAWSWPVPSSAEVKEWVELYLHFPSTPSWRGAQLKHRDNVTFTLLPWYSESFPVSFLKTCRSKSTKPQFYTLFCIGVKLGLSH
jgi:hypothetical protein